MDQTRRNKLMFLIKKGVDDGNSLTLSKHKAMLATKSEYEHLKILSEDAEYQALRMRYLTQHRRNRQWTK